MEQGVATAALRDGQAPLPGLRDIVDVTEEARHVAECRAQENGEQHQLAVDKQHIEHGQQLIPGIEVAGGLVLFLRGLLLGGGRFLIFVLTERLAVHVDGVLLVFLICTDVLVIWMLGITFDAVGSLAELDRVAILSRLLVISVFELREVVRHLLEDVHVFKTFESLVDKLLVLLGEHFVRHLLNSDSLEQSRLVRPDFFHGLVDSRGVDFNRIRVLSGRIALRPILLRLWLGGDAGLVVDCRLIVVSVGRVFGSVVLSRLMSLEVLLFDHLVAVDVPPEHEWDKEANHEQR